MKLKETGKLVYFRKRLNQSKFYYLLFALPILYYIIFCYVPMAGIMLAFKKYNAYAGFAKSKWVGFKYFVEFFQDPYSYKLIRNTVLLGLCQLIFAFPIPIFLALFINELPNGRTKKAVQTISYMPHFLSTVVICGMITNFLKTDGMLYNLLGSLGLKQHQYLMEPQYFRAIYTLSEIWQSAGWSSIIYLAALTGIDPQLYEAATIDGASRFRQLLHVTLPGIASTIAILFIFQVGSIMDNSFDKIILLYTPLTYETADTLSTFIYRRGLLGNDYGYAQAVGIFSSIVSFGFLMLANFASSHISGNSIWGGSKQ